MRCYFSTHWAFCDELGIFFHEICTIISRRIGHFAMKHAFFDQTCIFFVVRETTHTDLHKNAHFMFFQRHMHFPDETCISQQNMHFPRCRESSVDAILKWSMFWCLNTMPGTTRRQECRYSQTSTPFFLSIGNADITRPRTRPQREHPHSDSWSILVLDLSTRKGIHDTCRHVSIRRVDNLSSRHVVTNGKISSHFMHPFIVMKAFRESPRTVSHTHRRTSVDKSCR